MEWLSTSVIETLMRIDDDRDKWLRRMIDVVMEIFILHVYAE